MSADPFPGTPPTPELAAFFNRCAAAWTARDADALIELFDFPHVIATGQSSIFMEDEAEARTNIETVFAKYHRNRVASMAIERLAMLDLPDDAARADVLWSLRDAGGTELLRFPTSYTLTHDDDDWRIVAVEAQGETDAWAGAGWA